MAINTKTRVQEPQSTGQPQAPHGCVHRSRKKAKTVSVNRAAQEEFRTEAHSSQDKTMRLPTSMRPRMRREQPRTGPAGCSLTGTATGKGPARVVDFE